MAFLLDRSRPKTNQHIFSGVAARVVPRAADFFRSRTERTREQSAVFASNRVGQIAADNGHGDRIVEQVRTHHDALVERGYVDRRVGMGFRNAIDEAVIAIVGTPFPAVTTGAAGAIGCSAAIAAGGAVTAECPAAEAVTAFAFATEGSADRAAASASAGCSSAACCADRSRATGCAVAAEACADAKADT